MLGDLAGRYAGPAPGVRPALPAAPAVDDVSESVKTLAAARQSLLTEARRILLKRLDGIDQGTAFAGAVRMVFHPLELTVFDALGWSKGDIKTEHARIQTMVTWAGIAGSTADRANAAALLLASETKLKAEGPPLEEQIAALQNQLATLRRARDDAAADVERRTVALERLKKVLPPEVTEQFEYRTNQAQSHFTPLITELQNRIKAIERMQGVDHRSVDSVRGSLEAIKRWMPDLANLTAHENFPLAIFQRDLSKYVAELPSLQTRLAALRGELDKEFAAAAQLLDDAAKS